MNKNRIHSPASKKLAWWLAPVLLIGMACQSVSGVGLPTATLGASASTVVSTVLESGTATREAGSLPATRVPSGLNRLEASAQAGDWTVAVLSWGLVDSIGSGQPDPGMRLLAVETTFLNRGSAWGSLLLDSQTRVNDAGGKTYALSNIVDTAEDYEIVLSGGLAPGEHGRHTCIFQVPEGSQGWIFQFTPDVLTWDGGQVVSIPLVPGPAAGGLPAEMTTFDPGVHALGDLVALGDLAVVVTGWQDQVVAETGARQVSVDTLVTNLNREAILGNDGGDFHVGLKDTTGRYFPEDYSAGTGNGVFPVENMLQLNPGEQAFIRSYFIVPADASGLEVFFDDHGPSQRFPFDPAYPRLNQRAFMDPGPAPASAAVPAVMPGDLAPGLHALGQDGSVGIFTVTVTGVKAEQKPDGDFGISSPGTELTVSYHIQLTGTPPVEYPAAMTTVPNTLIATLKDGAGRYYHPKLSAYNDTPMNPGESVDLQSTFFVPDGSGTLTLVLASNFADLKGFFALK